MKTILTICATIFFLSAILFQTRANIIAGPITNPDNGHEYYLLTPNTWSASEAEAENLGGTLAIVRNPAEQKWVYSTFGFNNGAPRNLWIGLHRTKPGGDFVWVNRNSADYMNWFEGEPNNKGGVETCVELWGEVPAPGTWNDNMESALESGIVEVSDPLPVTDKQRALTGDWYMSGRVDRICHIAETKKALFVINEMNNGGRIVFGKKRFLFIMPWGIRGEVVEDKILWSNGTWWSRQPAEYGADEKSPDKDAAK